MIISWNALKLTLKKPTKFAIVKQKVNDTQIYIIMFYDCTGYYLQLIFDTFDEIVSFCNSLFEKHFLAIMTKDYTIRYLDIVFDQSIDIQEIKQLQHLLLYPSKVECEKKLRDMKKRIFG